MKIIILTTISLIALFLYSCKSSEDNNTVENIEEIVTEIESVSTTENDTVKKNYEIKENQENLKKIEKKYGEQWGFCECIVANDSIDKAVKGLVDFETPQAEKLLDRFDYVSKKCQAFLGMDANRTPDERMKHERKVKRCLKDAQK